MKELFLDTSTIFAYVQDPSIELYGEVVNELVADIKKRGLNFKISESVKVEYEDKYRELYEKTINSLREIYRQSKDRHLDKSPLLLLEDTITLMRSDLKKVTLLNLLELISYREIKRGAVKNVDDLQGFLRALLEIWLPFADHARKNYKVLSPLVVPVVGDEADEDIFKSLGMDGDDSKHLASISKYCKETNSDAIFITIDSKILSRKKEIKNGFKGLDVVSPLYVNEYLATDDM
jgi:hypothetical protein